MSETPSVELRGNDGTTGSVKLPEEHVSESLKNEIREQLGAPAIQNSPVYQPDCHGGIGPHAIVGFSMQLVNRVVPSIVGGDIGCGMEASRLGGVSVDLDDEDDLQRINEEVRDNVPMGTGIAHDEPLDNVLENFLWDLANDILRQLFETLDFESESFEDNQFDHEYVEDLCRRVGISMEYLKQSLCTLGDGNHFNEVSVSESTGDVWIVTHSGSRNLGQKVKSTWQEQATTYRDNEVHYDELSEEEQQYMTPKGEIHADKIRADFDGEEIAAMFESLKGAKPDTHRNKKLDYLEGEEMVGYLRDMVFAQIYAIYNRRLMNEQIASALGATIEETITSPHNYIDFEDMMVRKGSTRAHEGETFVIPMNMKDGTLVCRGKGNEEYNKSAPHGAGRLGSRGWAHEEFDAEEVESEMAEAGIWTDHVPGDEVPQAYKDIELIEQQIEPTAEVVDRLKPVMSFKA